MHISNLYKKKDTVISFEIFPPKEDYPIEKLYTAIDDLKELNPDFISVTYGSGGGRRDRTVEIASIVKNKFKIECLAHFTCIDSSNSDTNDLISSLSNIGIDNILALRGDIPIDFQRKDRSELLFAKDLIKNIKNTGGFCIGAAAYPEGHIECNSLDLSIMHLKEKVDSGADFLITQLFFDNETFYNFKDKALSKGINIPISAGIMPVLNKNQIKRITELSGASLPKKFIRILDKYEYNPEALKEAGIAYATEQIIDLLAWGIEGVHIYTMNKAEVAKRIVSNIKEIRSTISKSKIV